MTASQPAAPGMPGEETIREMVEAAQSGLLTDSEAARAILDLIHPAFEAKEREKAAALGLIEGHAAVIAQLEAKLAQAVEALEPFSKVADAFKPAMPDDERRWPGHIPLPTVADFRRARSASAAARGETTTLAEGKEG